MERGHSSEVFKSTWRGQTVAVKKVGFNTRDGNLLKEFQSEISTTIKLRPHPNLVTLIGVSEKDQSLYIVN